MTVTTRKNLTLFTTLNHRKVKSKRNDFTLNSFQLHRSRRNGHPFKRDVESDLEQPEQRLRATHIHLTTVHVYIDEENVRISEYSKQSDTGTAHRVWHILRTTSRADQAPHPLRNPSSHHHPQMLHKNTKATNISGCIVQNTGFLNTQHYVHCYLPRQSIQHGTKIRRKRNASVGCTNKAKKSCELDYLGNYATV